MARYKQETEIRRVPVGVEVESLYARHRRPYMNPEDFKRLLDGPVVIEEKLDGHPEVLEFAGYVFYCEDLHWKHSVPYTKVPPPMSPDAPPFWVCYDVWIGDENRWATREEKEALCQTAGLPIPPLVYVGDLMPDRISDLAARQSGFGETQCEGIVIKNYKTGLFGKFINREFQDGVEDAEHWRRAPLVPNQIASDDKTVTNT